MASFASTHLVTRLVLLFSLFCFTSAARRLTESTQDQNPDIFQYDNGPLLSGKISINLIWYGNFKPSQRAIISDFIASLSSTSKPMTDQPSVATWWKNTEKYYYNRLINSKKASSLGLSTGNQVLDENYSMGKSLTSQQIERLAAKGDQYNAINVVLTSSDVIVDGFCSSRCGTYGSSKSAQSPRDPQPLPDLATEIVIPVCTVVGIVFSLVQCFLVSQVKLSAGRNASSTTKNKSGYTDCLIAEEEGVNEHNVVAKCAEIQNAISEERERRGRVRNEDLIRESGRKLSQWLYLGGVKAFADGSLGSNSALFYEPYVDDPHNSGLQVTDFESLLNMTVASDRSGLQVAIHAIGDRANDLILDVYKSVVSTNGMRDRRFRIEHAQHLADGTVARFGQEGIVASVQPDHLLDDADSAIRKLGVERAHKGSYLFQSLLASKAQLVFGSDWPFADIDPVKSVKTAMKRIPPGWENAWISSECINLSDALNAYTISAARACFLDEDVGSLSPGKFADFVVLSTDSWDDFVAKGSASVKATYVGGVRAYP